ncbi:sugar phosphate nucleotidyltransferase [Paenibacillus glycanilyticus]|uniref:Glucose-1-phosphate adenylyltransferase n=1 Tax=Paenibacillus glycanilyticus TaxID=126569 RepID=A0ABQ6G5R8_9BACL|nr:sugar phosphate nucleotidyltransferase [Paenibacillus glycanilyticus]GLX66314.1 glucose-1-phosphate adenylyltransferase [Paenibacillus glycanilyticus]
MPQMNCMAMLLAGGEGKRLAPLTAALAKPVVPFGERYRMIDFPLSNCMNSGIRHIGVLTQYRADTVHNHIGDGGAWLDAVQAKQLGEIALLPASDTSPDNCYSGTADAIYRNLSFIEQHNPEHVLILSGDHIYQMDYRPMLEAHIHSGATATIAVKRVPWHEASRFGILNTNEDYSVVEFEEKPSRPRSNLASMGIYMFRTDKLKEVLANDARNPSSSHDFGKDIIPMLLQEGANLTAYPYEGYWRDVGTVDSLWEAHMELLDGTLRLAKPEWPLQSGYVPALNRQPYRLNTSAIPHDCIVDRQCRFEGVAQRSVVCAGAEVGSGSLVYESVIMPGARIGRNVRIHKAIIGENAIVEDGAVIGAPQAERIAVIGPGERVAAERKTVSASRETLAALLTGTGSNRLERKVLSY